MNFLKKARVDKGYNRTEAAYRLGATEGALYRWESGKSKPKYLWIDKLIEVYDVTREELYAYLEDKEVSEPLEKIA